MSVSNLQAIPLGPLAWRLTWTSDIVGATFRVFRDGLLVATSTAAEYTFTAAPGQSPSIDVLDDPDDVPEPAYPAHVILTWRPGTPAADAYRIDTLRGAKWIKQGTVVPSTDGQTYFEFRTSTLADDTLHVFRIVPIANGVDGYPSEHRMLMVRRPDPPAVAYSLDRLTGRITAAAAVPSFGF